MRQEHLLGHTLQELRILIKNFRNARIDHNLGLTYNESLILTTIRDNDGITAVQLSALLKSDKSTISRQIKSLEARGFISKIQQKDNKRLYKLEITPAGNENLNSTDNLWENLIEKKLSHWTLGEKENFLYLLKKYNAEA